MPTSTSDPEAKARTRRANHVRELARNAGFDTCGIVSAMGHDRSADLDAFVAAGHHGTMAWMKETRARRASPMVLWPEARSIIMLGMNYGPENDPRTQLVQPSKGNISVYARNRDYHDVIKGKLKDVASRFAARWHAEVKVFVDTAPVMEKPLAAAAGLGWQGRHTNLVSRNFGSWLFLGSIFTTADLDADKAEVDHCGSCRACLDACPTNAFPTPYQIDARRCISYLTIEHKGVIDPDLRPLLGNRIYGCDDCLAACPWNKFAQTAREMKLKPRADLMEPPLKELLDLDDAAFRAFFSGSPVKRIGRVKFISNCLIAAGNSGDPALLEPCRRLLQDPAPEIRAMAVWAISRLEGLAALHYLKQELAGETANVVLEEMKRAERAI